MKRIVLKILGCFMTLLSFSSNSLANECLTNEDLQVRAALNSASVKNCIENRAENSVIGKILTGTIAANELRVVASRSLREIVSQNIVALGNGEYQDYVAMLRSSLEVTASCVEAAETNLEAWSCSRVDIFDGEAYRFFPDVEAIVPISMKEAISHCLVKNVSECPEESSFVASFAEALYLANLVSVQISSEAAEKVAKENQLRFDQWNSYLYDGKFPYWWEMNFNRWMRRNDDENRDSTGNLIGPRKIPTGRWILMHPDAVAQAHRESIDDDVSLSFSLELIGYQWFRGWNEDKRKYEHPIGFGVGTAYFDKSDGQHMSVGLNVHYRKFSVGLHDIDSDFAVLVNFDVLEFLRDEDKGRKARLILGLEEDEKISLDDF
jgi:hypothetical protein